MTQLLQDVDFAQRRFFPAGSRVLHQALAFVVNDLARDLLAAEGIFGEEHLGLRSTTQESDRSCDGVVGFEVLPSD